MVIHFHSLVLYMNIIENVLFVNTHVPIVQIIFAHYIQNHATSPIGLNHF